MKRSILFISVLLLAACSQKDKTETSTATTIDSTTITSDSVNTSSFKPATIDEQVIYSRALNAVIWSMPAVNSELMHQSLLSAKGDYNQLAYWSGLLNSKNQTLTPNPNVIYLNPL